MHTTRTSISYVAPGKAMTMSTALHFAVANGNARAVRALLRAGADPEAALDKAGNTPLHFASQKGQNALVELLLDAGADPNVVNGVNDTPLHVGAANGHADVVTALLHGGAWYNVENSKGKVAREVSGTVFAASSRVAPRKRVLAAFQAYARNRTTARDSDSSASEAPAPAPAPAAAAPTPPDPKPYVPPSPETMDPATLRAQQLAVTITPALRHVFVRHNVSLLSAFEMLDAGAEGALNIEELARGLWALQVELDERETEEVMHIVESGIEGGIDYREFLAQLLLLAQAEAQQQAAEADADREVAATMRYNSPLDTPSSDAGPQIRGGSAPAASMGAGRASDDSLSLPFSTGLGPDGPLVSSSTVRERTPSLHFRVAQTEH